VRTHGLIVTSRVSEAVDYPPCPQCLALQGDPCRSPSSATCKPHLARVSPWRSRRPIKLGAEVAAWLAQQKLSDRAHARLFDGQVILAYHACGHTSWVDYGRLLPHQGGMSADACKLMAKRWTWDKGGVGAPCPTCKPTRGAKTAVARAARRGPDWISA
jgi:hypothetical protein